MEWCGGFVVHSGVVVLPSFAVPGPTFVAVGFVVAAAAGAAAVRVSSML